MTITRTSSVLALLVAALVPAGPAAAQGVPTGIQNAFGAPSGGPNPAFPAPPPPGPGFDGPPAAQPQPFPPQQAQEPLSIQQYLVSVWHGRTQDQNGQWDITVTFLPDATFVQQQTLLANNFRIQILGQYRAELGPQGGVLEFRPQRWEPRQVCQGQNACQPINLQPTSVRFRLLSHDTVQTEQGTFQRVGAVQ